MPRLSPGDTLIDVGTGDGLIAFGALDRLGASGRVIFSGISQDLLDHFREAADAEGLLDRCRFVLAPADSLTRVADESADVVTTWSVLIYVKDKQAALQEFYRVLRPGGRMSLFEPINVLMSAADPHLFFGYDVTAVRDLAARVQAVYESIQPPGADPMLDFDDRPGSVRPASRFPRSPPRAAGEREGPEGASSLGTLPAHLRKPP
jgi:arsenite methyltransferase